MIGDGQAPGPLSSPWRCWSPAAGTGRAPPAGGAGSRWLPNCCGDPQRRDHLRQWIGDVRQEGVHGATSTRGLCPGAIASSRRRRQQLGQQCLEMVGWLLSPEDELLGRHATRTTCHLNAQRSVVHMQVGRYLQMISIMDCFLYDSFRVKWLGLQMIFVISDIYICKNYTLFSIGQSRQRHLTHSLHALSYP